MGDMVHVDDQYGGSPINSGLINTGSKFAYADRVVMPESRSLKSMDQERVPCITRYMSFDLPVIVYPDGARKLKYHATATFTNTPRIRNPRM